MAQADPHENDLGRQITVNRRPVRLTDSEPIGSQVLAEAGFEPVDEHVLIQRFGSGSQLISPDERVGLRGAGMARFYAFRTGEVFTLTVNEQSFQWGRPGITEPELREFADVPNGDVLVLNAGGDEPRILSAGDRVELCAPGVQHLKTERRLATVFIDNNEKHIPRGVHTTEELLVLLQVQAGYLLNLATDKGLTPLRPQQTIRVKDGMRFFSQVPAGGSAH